MVAFSAVLSGYLLSISLIAAIGAQNAFVLRQGLRREHVFAVVIVQSIVEEAVISVGRESCVSIEPIVRYE